MRSRRSDGRVTLPARGVARLRVGVVSCSNYPFGYFTACRHWPGGPTSTRFCTSATTSEFQNGRFGDGAAVGRIQAKRPRLSRWPITGCATPNTRPTPDSQAVHRQHPFIVVWDDHGLANNAWSGGAENHQPEKGEGDWSVRRNAVQAFFEWMPIREDAATLAPRIYRTLRWGDLADLIMLDTRLVGRDQQADRRDDVAAIESPPAPAWDRTGTVAARRAR